MQTNKKKELVRVVRFTLFSASAGFGWGVLLRFYSCLLTTF